MPAAPLLPLPASPYPPNICPFSLSSLLQATEFLQSYSNRSVTTVSALCVVNVETGVRAEGLHESTVFWREIPSDVVDAVVAGGNTMGSVSDVYYCSASCCCSAGDPILNGDRKIGCTIAITTNIQSTLGTPFRPVYGTLLGRHSLWSWVWWLCRLRNERSRHVFLLYRCLPQRPSKRDACG